MAKKNYLNKLPHLGGAAVMTMAMAAVLATPASATEVEGAPVDAAPVVEAAPVVAAAPVVEAAPAPAPEIPDPAPAETSSSAQEVSGYNEAVSESNDQAVSDNNGTAVENEFTGSDNNGTVVENESVPSGNETVDNGNETIDSGNQTSDTGNQEAIEGNEDLTTDLPDAPEAPDLPEAPNLPEVPEIPEAPETPDLSDTSTDDYNDGVDDYNGKVDDYNENAEDYNEAVGKYNEAVDGYNNAVGGYNEAVGEYNDAVEDYNVKVDEINQQLQDQYEADHSQWEHDKAENKLDQDIYTEKETDYKKAEAEYLAAKKAYEDAYARWEDEYDAWETRKNNYIIENGTEAEFDAQMEAYKKAYSEWDAECTKRKNEYEAKKALYEQYLKDQAAYDKYEDDLDTYEHEKEIYDQLVTENEIYDDVLEYNDQVQKDNNGIQDLNKQLTSDLDTGAVANLEAATLNANVNEQLKATEEGKALLETLSEKNREALADAEDQLAERAAALDAEANNNNYTLGSEAYADYLARVKQFNADVEAHNANLAAYNKAVEDYNAYVDKFNADNKPVEGDSSTGAGQDKQAADWGNINIENKTLDHIDVKYQAASSKNVVEVNGEKTYSDAVTGYEVTGVYKDENKGSFGLYYDNDGSEGSQKEKTQGLTRNSNDSEFMHTSMNARLDPATGTVRFYVTLKDSNNETHGIYVNMDATSVYAAGSYYTPVDSKEDQYLAAFRDSNGALTKVDTNNDGVADSYDISGKSVFVISAMTCDGMGGNMNTGKQNKLSWNPHGLDLVLNLQTMIQIHQADNAQKITYQGGYLQGKLAYAEAPADPGKEPVKPEEVKKPTEVDKPTLVLPDEPDVKYPGDEYIPFSEEAPTPPSEDYKKLDPGKFEEQKPDDFTDPEPQLVQLSKLDPINELKYMDELKPIDYLQNKLDYKMVLVIPEVTPEGPDPIVIPDAPAPTPRIAVVANKNLKNTVTIVDEKIPLAKAPKTGDISSIWAVISGLSLGGMTLLNRKRKEEE